MKKEAVTMRPIASINTERVGYHTSGTGLVIGFGAFKAEKEENHKVNKRKRNPDHKQRKEKSFG